MQKRKSNSLSAKTDTQVDGGSFSVSSKRNIAKSQGAKRKLSLAEVADKLKDRKLFSEKKERAKSFLNKLQSLPI